MWYVAPLEMNEGTHWGQGYNRPTGCSAEKAPHSTCNFITFWQNGMNFLRRLALQGKHLMTSRVSMSLPCFRDCFLPGRAKDLSAPPVMHGVFLRYYQYYLLVPCYLYLCTA